MSYNKKRLVVGMSGASGAILGITLLELMKKIKELTLDDTHQYRLNTGAFLAMDTSASYHMVSQKVSGAAFLPS